MWECSKKITAFPVDSRSHIADLLGELDAFLRSGHPVGDQLTEFMRRHGHPHPGFAPNLIDDLSFTTFSYRRLAGTTTIHLPE